MQIAELILPLLLVIGIAYGIMTKIQITTTLKNQVAQGNKKLKKLLVGHSLSLIGMIGFLICFVADFFIYSFVYYNPTTPIIINDNFVKFGCYVFIILFFIAQYGIISKNKLK
ncbi:MAG: hypothetical protein ACI35O_10730 [Bacillaceae bacterium]